MSWRSVVRAGCAPRFRAYPGARAFARFWNLCVGASWFHLGISRCHARAITVQLGSDHEESDRARPWWTNPPGMLTGPGAPQPLRS